jgi:ATP-dependent DNA helicase RecG
MALGLMRERGSVTNGMLRQLGLERHDATTALADLVARGLAVRFGGRRYAEYFLVDETPPPAGPPRPTAGPPRDRLEEIDRLFDHADTVRAADVESATALKPAMVRRYLTRLIEQGRIEATAPPQSRSRAYRRARRGEGT